MTSNKLSSRSTLRKLIAASALFAGAVLWAAQAPPARYVGTVTAVDGDMLTVKTDAGDVRQAQVSSTAVLKRVEPGQKDLSAAVDISLIDITTGDRVLVRLDPSANPPQALQIITIKQADVALKQQQERDAWQKTGIGGLVKSIDPSAQTIVVAGGAGSMSHTIAVHVTSSTILKRYAPASVRFDLAQPAPLSEIHVGDQLRARGVKSADGTSLDAAEIVSGSFHNLSGTISSLDPATSTFVMKDRLSKKQVTVHISPDAQMHILSQTMATALAARLKKPSDAQGASGAPPNGAPARNGGSSFSAQLHAANGYSDVQQLLSRSPVLQFADLKKGAAVMVVATGDSTDATAIRLLAGVEPLLQAPESTSNLLSNWSMGSTSADSAAQ